jgi:uncharacterized protein YacL
MVLHILRALFVLLMAAVGWSFIKDPATFGTYSWLAMAIGMVVAVFLLSIDILSTRRKLAVFSGVFFGLVVGICIAYALSFVTPLIVDYYQSFSDDKLGAKQYAALIRYIDLFIGVTTTYLAISFILQTKDDFRFVIPYVEFSKQTKGARPFVLDSSVLIDGRIEDIAKTGIMESQLVVPRFIQSELQRLADSSDKLIRARGRRGLDVLTSLKSAAHPEVIDYDSSGRDDQALDVDQKLIALSKELNGRVLTNDYNLNKVAQLRGVDVVNLNELANAMKPEVMPGEKMTVRLIKPGESTGQGVGYLDDGTMVVVEGGRPHLNEDVEFTVTNTRQTVQGRMIFGRLGSNGASTGTSPAPAQTSRKTPQPEAHGPK